MRDLYDLIESCKTCEKASMHNVNLHKTSSDGFPFVLCENCTKALDAIKSSFTSETKIIRNVSKVLVMTLISFNFIACAAMEKRIIDPQGRGEAQQFATGDACYKYAKSGYRSTFVEKYDACMRANGYDFEYVEAKK